MSRRSTPPLRQAIRNAGTAPISVGTELLGEAPLSRQVRVHRVAVEHHDRGPEQQRVDQRHPHHPGGGREPEQPVPGLQVPAQALVLEGLDQDAAVAVDDRLRQSGRPRGEEDAERVVEADRVELERPALGEQLVPLECLRAGRRRVRPGRGRGRPARGWEGPRGSRLPRRGGRSASRRRCSRRSRAAASARAGRSGRSRCGGRTPARRSPRSRPGSPWPRNATRVSGMLGRYATTRSPGPIPRRCRPARARATCSRSSPKVRSKSSRVCDRASTATWSVSSSRPTMCSA